MTWGDVDLPRGVLTISMGKAKRIDEIALHPDLLVELTRVKPSDVLPTARVFPTAVINATRRGDYEAADIKEVGEDGRHADLHSLRSTLGTRLARQGVAPQVAQRIMRHSDYRTTVKHYVRLELSDSAAAVQTLPSIAALPLNEKPKAEPKSRRHRQQKRQQLEAETVLQVAG